MNFNLQRFHGFARLFIYGISAGVVTLVFLFHPGINGYERAMFSDMVEGKAHRPYVYRTLVPTGVRLVSNATPAFLKGELSAAIKDTRLIKKLGWETERLPDYVIATAIIFGCFIGFAFAQRGLIQTFFPRYPLVAEFAPLLNLIILPIFFRYYNHLYDAATILLFTLSFLFLARQSLGWYHVSFGLAVVNKETAILLIPLFYVSLRHSLSKSSLAVYITLQVILYIIVKGIITQVFAENPGSFVEYHLRDNLYLLGRPSSLFHLMTVFVVFGFLILYRWEEKPVFLRRGLALSLAPLIFLSVFFGNIDETRGYYEALSLAFLLSLPTLMAIFGVDLHDKGM